MPCSLKRRWMLSLLFCVVALWGTAWAADVQVPPAAPAEPVPEKPDPFVVPDGTPAELLEYIQRLRTLRPETPRDPESVKEFAGKLHRAINEAAEKALAGEPTKEQVSEAALWKTIALLSLQQLGDTAAEKRLETFLGELQQAGHKTVVRELRGLLLQNRMRGAMIAGRKELEKLLAEVKQFIGQEPLGDTEIRLAMASTRMLEMTGNMDLAADAYGTFGRMFAASDNQALAAYGAKMIGAARRVTLVGKPMPLEGNFLDGKPFDWAGYQGKVVLVQFWATWCGPCRAEIVNVKKNYELYHDRGFEVVGVNCDDQRKDLEEFLKTNQLPWKNLFSEDPAAAGMNNPMAVYYGVLGIPQLILVGPDGNVVSLEVRGPKLGEQLEKLLGPAETAPEKANRPGNRVSG